MTAGNGGGLSDMNGVLIFDQEAKDVTTPDIKFTGQFNMEFQRRNLFPLRTSDVQRRQRSDRLHGGGGKSLGLWRQFINGYVWM